jgi:hypothetical protein
MKIDKGIKPKGQSVGMADPAPRYSKRTADAPIESIDTSPASNRHRVCPPWRLRVDALRLSRRRHALPACLLAGLSIEEVTYVRSSAIMRERVSRRRYHFAAGRFDSIETHGRFDSIETALASSVKLNAHTTNQPRRCRGCPTTHTHEHLSTLARRRRLAKTDVPREMGGILHHVAPPLDLLRRRRERSFASLPRAPVWRDDLYTPLFLTTHPLGGFFFHVTSTAAGAAAFESIDRSGPGSLCLI